MNGHRNKCIFKPIFNIFLVFFLLNEQNRENQSSVYHNIECIITYHPESLFLEAILFKYYDFFGNINASSLVEKSYNLFPFIN